MEWSYENSPIQFLSRDDWYSINRSPFFTTTPNIHHTISSPYTSKSACLNTLSNSTWQLRSRFGTALTTTSNSVEDWNMHTRQYPSWWCEVLEGVLEVMMRQETRQGHVTITWSHGTPHNLSRDTVPPLPTFSYQTSTYWTLCYRLNLRWQNEIYDEHWGYWVGREIHV